MIRAAATAAALGLVLAAVLLTARDERLRANAPKPAASPAQDELARCRQAGEAALSDPACSRTWAASRDHFLGRAGS